METPTLINLNKYLVDHILSYLVLYQEVKIRFLNKRLQRHKLEYNRNLLKCLSLLSGISCLNYRAFFEDFEELEVKYTSFLFDLAFASVKNIKHKDLINGIAMMMRMIADKYSCYSLVVDLNEISPKLKDYAQVFKVLDRDIFECDIQLAETFDIANCTQQETLILSEILTSIKLVRAPLREIALLTMLNSLDIQLHFIYIDFEAVKDDWDVTIEYFSRFPNSLSEIWTRGHNIDSDDFKKMETLIELNKNSLKSIFLDSHKEAFEELQLMLDKLNGWNLQYKYSSIDTNDADLIGDIMKGFSNHPVQIKQLVVIESLIVTDNYAEVLEFLNKASNLESIIINSDISSADELVAFMSNLNLYGLKKLTLKISEFKYPNVLPSILKKFVKLTELRLEEDSKVKFFISNHLYLSYSDESFTNTVLESNIIPMILKNNINSGPINICNDNSEELLDILNNIKDHEIRTNIKHIKVPKNISIILPLLPNLEALTLTSTDIHDELSIRIDTLKYLSIDSILTYDQKFFEFVLSKQVRIIEVNKDSDNYFMKFFLENVSKFTQLRSLFVFDNNIPADLFNYDNISDLTNHPTLLSLCITIENSSNFSKSCRRQLNAIYRVDLQ